MLPSLKQLEPYRYDRECYEVAHGISNKWPQLREDAGFYVHPTRGPGDHGWNVAPDGTIVDMTAAQHDYNGPEDEPDWVEDDGVPFPAPKHPEVIPPDHPLYKNYVSWDTGDQAQLLAHQIGYHDGHSDNANVCPACQGRTANILDPIHGELDPTVWDAAGEENPRLKDVHLKWIKNTVFSVLRANGLRNPEKFCSLVFTGSLTTYQYSPESDCDISLFVDYELATVKRAYLIGLMVANTDGVLLPGTTHPMQCFVVPESISKDDLYQRGLRSGYDLDTNSWIIPPEKDRVHDVEKEENGYYVTALLAADKMERLLRYEPDKAVMYWHQIHARRQRDQRAAKGDFAESNIVYKMLNNRGLFPQIEQASGEHIAKTAGWPVVKKFVYDGDTNKLILGKEALEEGETYSHNQLAQQIGADRLGGNTLCGTINNKNYAMFEFGGKGVRPTTYTAAEEALRQAHPIEGVIGNSMILPNHPWKDVAPQITDLNVDPKTLDNVDLGLDNEGWQL
jgi:hypothetical protein